MLFSQNDFIVHLLLKNQGLTCSGKTLLFNYVVMTFQIGHGYIFIIVKKKKSQAN